MADLRSQQRLQNGLGRFRMWLQAIGGCVIIGVEQAYNGLEDRKKKLEPWLITKRK